MFSLKKTDAIDISVAFPKIWKEIVATSIHNMKQIKQLIEKTLMFFYENNKMVLEQLNEHYSFLNSKTEGEEIQKLLFNSNNSKSIFNKKRIKHQSKALLLF